METNHLANHNGDSFREVRPSCCSLVYSPCPGFRELFPLLISTLQATVPHKAWLLFGPLAENACSAKFRAGKTGGTVVSIGVLDCSLVIKAKVMRDDAIFSEIRSWFEDGILAIRPSFDCSIYVSPCTDGSGEDWLKVVCVHNSTRIGSLRELHNSSNTNSPNKDMNIVHLYCPQHCKLLGLERYQHWFGLKFVHDHLRDSFRNKQEKILMDIAKEIGSWADLYEIATHLNVRKIDVDVKMANGKELTVAAYDVLHKWYTSQSGQCLPYQRQDQLANAFEAAGLNKECVYHAYHSMC